MAIDTPCTIKVVAWKSQCQSGHQSWALEKVSSSPFTRRKEVTAGFTLLAAEVALLPSFISLFSFQSSIKLSWKLLNHWSMKIRIKKLVHIFSTWGNDNNFTSFNKYVNLKEKYAVYRQNEQSLIIQSPELSTVSNLKCCLCKCFFSLINNKRKGLVLFILFGLWLFVP